MAKGDSKRLTEAAVEKTKPPKTGRKEVWDALVKGLALRVSASGSKSWSLMYRITGDTTGPRGNAKVRRLTLGRWPAMDLTTARDRAADALEKAKLGEAPAEEREQERKHAARRRENTVGTLIDRFYREYCLPNGLRTADSIERTLRHRLTGPLEGQHGRQWGDRPADAVTRDDVRELLKEVVDEGHGPHANFIHATMRKMYRWAIGEGILTANPVEDVPAPARVASRERTLTEDEIRAFWAACDRMGQPFGALFKTLLVTAQRREEVGDMQWRELDLSEGLLRLPPERTKAARGHSVPLSPLARSVLNELPAAGPYVFATERTDYQRPVSGYSKAKRRLDELMAEELGGELTPWRLHDLRRTVGTMMAERLEVPPYVISRVLNHAEGGVTQVYNRASYLREKREALDAWSRELERMLGLQQTPSPQERQLAAAADQLAGLLPGGDNVVPFKQKAG